MENNILTTHSNNRIYYHTKFTKIDDLHDNIQELLSNRSFPDFVGETYHLLKQKDDKLRNMIKPIQDTFERYKILHQEEQNLQGGIDQISANINTVVRGTNNYLRPHLEPRSGGSKKIYTKREHKKPTKEKTTIKRVSRTIKSSKLKTTKKK